MMCKGKKSENTYLKQSDDDIIIFFLMCYPPAYRMHPLTPADGPIIFIRDHLRLQIFLLYLNITLVSYAYEWTLNTIKSYFSLYTLPFLSFVASLY